MQRVVTTAVILAVALGTDAASAVDEEAPAACMDDPSASVDSSCTEGLVPRFVLPDEPLGGP